MEKLIRRLDESHDEIILTFTSVSERDRHCRGIPMDLPPDMEIGVRWVDEMTVRIAPRPKPVPPPPAIATPAAPATAEPQRPPIQPPPGLVEKLPEKLPAEPAATTIKQSEPAAPTLAGLLGAEREVLTKAKLADLETAAAEAGCPVVIDSKRPARRSWGKSSSGASPGRSDYSGDPKVLEPVLRKTMDPDQTTAPAEAAPAPDTTTADAPPVATTVPPAQQPAPTSPETTPPTSPYPTVGQTAQADPLAGVAPGRTVHYVLPEAKNPDDSVVPLADRTHRPAIITSDWRGPTQNLTVFLDQSNDLAQELVDAGAFRHSSCEKVNAWTARAWSVPFDPPGSPAPGTGPSEPEPAARGIAPHASGITLPGVLMRVVKPAASLDERIFIPAQQPDMAGDAISERTQSIGTTAAGDNVVLDAPVGTPGWAVVQATRALPTTSSSACRCPARSTCGRSCLAGETQPTRCGSACAANAIYARANTARGSAESQDRRGVSPRPARGIAPRDATTRPPAPLVRRARHRD
jgi:hypothetical protein